MTTPKRTKKQTSRAIVNTVATAQPLQRIPKVSLASRLRTLNRWRESYNPMRGLSVNRAVTLCEAYPRGEYADLMWTYAAPMLGIECADADLIALIERRTGAVLEMDYSIKTVDPVSKGFDKVLASEQAAALTERYNSFDNLYEVIEHLSMATFRGFSHAELIRDYTGEIKTLQIVDQWNVVRDGINDRWKYNPEALPVGYQMLPDDYEMPRDAFLRRIVARPVNRIALMKAIRSNLSQRDWDFFIEVYGVPGGVITMPPNVPPEMRDEYERAARDVAEGGNGALPHGALYTPNSSPHGNNPFRDHLEYWTQKLVLAGTGGLLTMLAESGTGTLAGGAHLEGFKTLGRTDARKTSAIFQGAIDSDLLKRRFPGRPHLAYFELAANEETDTGEFVKDVAQLAGAGYQVDPAQIEEKTGYKVTLKDPALQGSGNALSKPLQNRRPPLSPSRGEQIAALLDTPDLRHSAAQLEQILLSAALES